MVAKLPDKSNMIPQHPALHKTDPEEIPEEFTGK